MASEVLIAQIEESLAGCEPKASSSYLPPYPKTPIEESLEAIREHRDARRSLRRRLERVRGADLSGRERCLDRGGPEPLHLSEPTHDYFSTTARTTTSCSFPLPVRADAPPQVALEWLCGGPDYAAIPAPFRSTT